MLSPRQELILKLVVDEYLASGTPVPSKEIAERSEVEWGPSTARAELTDLMALVTAPPETVAATIHRVEVLRLQPSRVMVVAIASNGAVAKRVFDFAGPVDPGLVEWASSYLNESLA